MGSIKLILNRLFWVDRYNFIGILTICGSAVTFVLFFLLNVAQWQVLSFVFSYAFEMNVNATQTELNSGSDETQQSYIIGEFQTRDQAR